MKGVVNYGQKCGTAEVDNPDAGRRGAGFNKNVLEL